MDALDLAGIVALAIAGPLVVWGAGTRASRSVAPPPPDPDESPLHAHSTPVDVGPAGTAPPVAVVPVGVAPVGGEAARGVAVVTTPAEEPTMEHSVLDPQ